MKCVHSILLLLALFACKNEHTGELSSNSSASASQQESSQIFTGVAQMNNDKALFIWDFALSESFSLEGLDVWDEKYLNKKITIRGELVQTEKGKSMIKNWEIIEVGESINFSNRKIQ